MGIPDNESYWPQDYVPSGWATGWRRGCMWGLVVLVFGLPIAAAIVFAVIRWLDW